MIGGRGGLIRINGGNVKFMERNQAKEKSISCHGHSERDIQGRYVCALYNSVYIDIFVYAIQYNCCLYFISGICSIFLL